MRVIRTEMYFDQADLERFGSANALNFGVSFAFFRSGRTFEVEELAGVFDGATIPLPQGPGVDFILQTFLENLVFGVEDVDHALLQRRSAEFVPFMNFFGSSTVVIENSPPSELDWRTLTKTASAVSIGTYIGFQIAPIGSPLLLLSVPAGIIAVGTAVGISRGLENGLNKSVEKLINKLLLR